jgi:hypothetical protein
MENGIRRVLNEMRQIDNYPKLMPEDQRFNRFFPIFHEMGLAAVTTVRKARNRNETHDSSSQFLRLLVLTLAIAQFVGTERH